MLMYMTQSNPACPCSSRRILCFSQQSCLVRPRHARCVHHLNVREWKPTRLTEVIDALDPVWFACLWISLAQAQDLNSRSSRGIAGKSHLPVRARGKVVQDYGTPLSPPFGTRKSHILNSVISPTHVASAAASKGGRISTACISWRRESGVWRDRSGAAPRVCVYTDSVAPP